MLFPHACTKLSMLSTNFWDSPRRSKVSMFLITRPSLDVVQILVRTLQDVLQSSKRKKEEKDCMPKYIRKIKKHLKIR